MKKLFDILTPEQPRVLPYARTLNIAFRTFHIIVVGIFLGGQTFEVEAERSKLYLYLSIVTGLCLMVVECYPSCRWFYQGRGVLVQLKLLLFATVPFFWSYRVPILIGVAIIASVGSHMPRRFRYYSLWHKRVLD